MTTRNDTPADLPDNWDLIPFPECLQPLDFQKPRKILARDYRPEGRVPVIDQGQSFIAGWTDAEDSALRDGLPLVVFGDHTRTFKFVDFPFALGADGTQLLKPGKDFDARFFYYACRQLPLPNRGYNRHFTLLKEQRIPRPPRREQEAIAHVLQLLEQAIATDEQRIARVDELMLSARARLFTGSIGGHSSADSGDFGPVPEHWVRLPISALGDVVTGTTPKTTQRAYYDGGDIPFIAPGDIGRTTRIYSSEKHLTQRGLAVARALPRDAVCFVCIGSTIGKVGITNHPVAATNQQINTILPSADHVPLFVCYLLQHFADYIANHASPSPVPIMSKGQFQQIRLPVPPDADEELHIAHTLEIIDATREKIAARLERFRELFAALLDELVTGKTSTANLDIAPRSQNA